MKNNKKNRKVASSTTRRSSLTDCSPKRQEGGEKGFTLIELLIVIAIIGILASVVVVGLPEIRQRAKDSSVLQSMTSVAPLAYRCMVKAKDTTNGRLTDPGSATAPTSICFGAGIDLSEFPAWPEIVSSDWGYGGTKFDWCDIGSSGSSHPEGRGYSDPASGGSRGEGKFCFVMANKYSSSNPDKWIWCTENGCGKEGF